ncbi:hypothetical protein JD292_00830 [Leucobacter sp. CSA2]|uniref:Uncharacterized protein n=1 Tax=Leucobacter edaphi TaxID=2796472 RepID=A0A934QCH4_9MICO|nr:hypothetical protein [Leucobacter edaphi]MBK0420624.1 hypothetical protein [Leucobacter edaphi]
MIENRNRSRLFLLPIGIAMVLGAGSFTFGSAGAQWMWADQPWVAVLFVALGAAMLAVAMFSRQPARTRPAKRARRR